jgi:two-component system sensor histidine kinase ChiS
MRFFHVQFARNGPIGFPFNRMSASLFQNRVWTGEPVKKIYPVILFLFSLSKILLPENLQIDFQHISITEGLSQNTVNCILQDKKGYMWFATEDGLNKYDGYNFTIYDSNPDDPAALNINYIWTIYEDRSGTLWIGTWGGGLNKFDRNNKCFTHYIHNPDNPYSISHNEVRTICEDHSGILWVGTKGGGLNKFAPDTERFIHFKNEPDNPFSISDNEVICLCVDQGGLLWIGTVNGGLNRFNPAAGGFTRFLYESGNPKSLSHNEVSYIYEDEAGVIWVGTKGGGLNRFNPGEMNFIRYKHNEKDPHSLSNNDISSIFEDKSGLFWVGTNGGGLNRFDRDTGVFTDSLNKPTNPDSLSTNDVRAIYEDKSGVLWVSTYGGGLNKRNRKKEKFSLYNADPGDPNSLSSQIIWSIFEDKAGVLWIGTSSGLDSYDRTANRFTHYKHNPREPGSLSDNHVRTIYEDKAGIIWVGTNSGGINRFVRSTGSFVHYRHDPDNAASLSHNMIRAIYEDKSGLIWIGTGGGGLDKFYRSTGRFTHYRHDPSNPKSLSHDFVYSIYEDRSGVFWVGTWGGGLNKFDRETGEFKRYQANSFRSHSLSNDLVLSIHEDASGMLWLGTSGGGLNKFNREDETFTHFREKEGLPNDVIYGILEDGRGNLWLSTNKGLSEFNPRTGVFKNYSVVDGLQSNEFNGGAYHKNKKGEMFFGGIDGFNCFFPEQLKDNNQYIPPIVITAFLKLNKKVKLEKPISEMEELTLTYKDHSFSFEFAALDYTAPERNKYAYKMENFNDDFIITDANKRFATYTSLPSGKYVFKVRGTNYDGKWNEEGASIRITVIPPLWEKGWFRGLIFLLLSCAVFIYFKVRIKKVRLELRKEQLEKDLKLKADFTAMLVHDLRSPLTSIMGYAEMMHTTPNIIDVERTGGIITKSSEKMLKIINDMLILSRFEAGKITLNKTYSTLSSIVKEHIEGMQPLLDMKQFKIEYDFSQLPKLFIDHEKIGQVVNNLINNAAKFTPEKGTIAIRTKNIKENGRKYQELAVMDNGPGIAQNKQKYLFEKYSQLHQDIKMKGTGLGLAVSRWIVESHGGQIGYSRREKGGSVFYFRLLQI